MNSLRRVVLTALLGAIIVISIAVATAQTSVPGPVLRLTMPEIEPKPDTSGANYTLANFERLQAWNDKYATPCVLVVFKLVDRPVYSFDGSGSAGAIMIVPMSRLELYRSQIQMGAIGWAPLSEAVSVLQAMPRTAAPDTATAAALQRAREAAAKAVEILTQP